MRKPLLLSALCGLLVVSCSCSREKTKDPEKVVDEELEGMLAEYQALQPTVEDSHGFVNADRCDSLLWTSLSHLHREIDIRAAFNEKTGQWYRSPDQTCFDRGASKSDVSRDMLLGLAWYAWIHRDLGIAESVFDYAQANGGRMGRGDLSRTLLSPPLTATYAQLIKKLGGADHVERNLVPVWVAETGFEANLVALHILLRQRIYDTIEETANDALAEQARRQPENAEFRFANREADVAATLLKTQPYWPRGRLPTSAERCEGEWLWQRDKGTDWDACPAEAKTHPGSELLFLGYLLTKGV